LLRRILVTIGDVANQYISFIDRSTQLGKKERKIRKTKKKLKIKKNKKKQRKEKKIGFSCLLECC